MHHQKGGALVARLVLTNGVCRQFASQAPVGFGKWPERDLAIMGSFVGRCAMFSEVPQQLQENSPGVFIHHLGHGVGLAAHAVPHLNLRWDDLFEGGDFFTVFTMTTCDMAWNWSKISWLLLAALGCRPTGLPAFGSPTHLS